MSRSAHPLHMLLRWPLVVVTLVGFLGLLALQSFSLPEELPREAIERLLGVDIAASAISPHTAEGHTAAMPGMAGHHHHAMGASGNDHGISPTKAPYPLHHHHHDGDGCPLCPLLSLPAALPMGIVLVPPPILRWMRRGSHASNPRAPPLLSLGLPPSRGPPA